MEKKNLIVGIAFFLVFTIFIILLISNVAAYTKLCLSDCQGTPVDNPRYVCELGSRSRCNDPGYCEVCVTDLGNPTAPYRCAGQTCSLLNGNTSVDANAPNLTVNNPIQDKIYNKRAVLLDLEVDEESALSYIDKIYGNNRWIKLCQHCFSYTNSKSFKEGLNNITIKAEDDYGNSAFFDVFFYVDSKKPVIKKTEPKNNKFANGEFIVTYYEENPKEIWLNYGNNLTGYRSAKLSGCVGGKKEECSINIDLGGYHGQEIEYWFNITDIAGYFVESKHTKVKVDLIPPILNYFNYNINGKYVTFNMSIIEPNFDKVEYIDNSDLRPRWKTLCTRLKNGWCTKKVTFRAGAHSLDIQFSDKAGNAIGFPVGFVI